jgi:hypothetical protein
VPPGGYTTPFIAVDRLLRFGCTPCHCFLIRPSRQSLGSCTPACSRSTVGACSRSTVGLLSFSSFELLLEKYSRCSVLEIVPDLIFASFSEAHKLMSIFPYHNEQLHCVGRTRGSTSERRRSPAAEHVRGEGHRRGLNVEGGGGLRGDRRRR